MKYVLAYVTDQSRMQDSSEEEMKEAIAAWTEFEREAVEKGALIASEPLDSSRAITVRVGEGAERTVTDGPFAETKEQLGGFTLLECADGDEALAWAKKVPLYPGAVIEVKPVMDLSRFGYESATVSPAKATA
jgi:hypothetical protein